MTEPAGTAATRRELTITRVFDAPRDLVFQAWTDPAQLTRWFGPRGMSTPRSTISVEARPGGRWRVCMVRDSDGSEYPTGGEYREVVPPERLVFTWGDPAETSEADGVAGISLVTVTFADLGDKTEMVLHQAGFSTDGARGDVYDGWSSAFDCLAEYIAAR
ncbi:SRPBCC family protein [Amycolatopsis nigrescens]|uniref:SRPBCC family protein n=1 Tax=Amycolatopsis nigrescens TaxID=381445 RepID=UPI00037643BC|nr:SRPBCC domain-containing protein [Amycolatopsis nigrescens]